MPDDLDQIAARASEDKKISCMRITAKRFLHLQSQAIHAAPHIGSPDRKPDAYARGNRDHRPSNTSSTHRRAFPSKLRPTRTRYLATTSISILSSTADGGAVTASCPAVIVTGIN